MSDPFVMWVYLVTFGGLLGYTAWVIRRLRGGRGDRP